jgi:hypothetical protein
LNDRFSQVRVSAWLGRRESVSDEGPRKAEPALQSVLGFSMFAICEALQIARRPRNSGCGASSRDR